MFSLLYTLFMVRSKAKEHLTYISMDYLTDLKTAKRTAAQKRTMQTLCDAMGGSLKKYFVLPDYQRITKGFVRADDAVLGLINDSVTSADQVSVFRFYTFNFCLFLFLKMSNRLL